MISILFDSGGKYMNLEAFLSSLQSWVTNVGIKIVIAVIILIISFLVINKISKSIEKKSLDFQKKNGKKIDHTVYRTLSYVAKTGLKILVVLALIGYLGIDTSAVSALIASLGVGVGLAVNGTLSNLAGGILLLLTRPFCDGDFISANGYEGTVEDIFICNTKIRTYDNKVVYLPNGKLSSSEIVNYSEKPTRRVDLTFSISYSDDFEKAAGLIREVAASNPLILKDPAPSARITKHGDSSIDIFSTAWCTTEDYWTVYFDMNEQVKKTFDENGISIPFPQLDVHLDK